MDAPIVLQRQHGRADIILNQPAKHNALGIVALRSLQGILRDLAGDQDLRVVTITGAGRRTFCAGAFLDDMESGAMSSQDFQDTTNLIAALPVPVIAAINGNAFGGGVELALSCDFRLGVLGSSIRVPAARLGLCYPLEGIDRFVESLGSAGAKRLLLLAEEWNTDQQLRFGFLDSVHDADVLPAQVNALAAQIAQLAPLAVRAMKYAIQNRALGDEVQRQARDWERRCALSDDLREGLLAAKSKRPAVFRGA